MAPLLRQQWMAHPRLCWRAQKGWQWESGSCHSPPQLFCCWQQHCQCNHGSPSWLPPAPHAYNTVAPAHDCCFCTSSSPCQMDGSRKQNGSCGIPRNPRIWLDHRCNNQKRWNTFSKLHVNHPSDKVSYLCKLSPSNCTLSMATSTLNRIPNLDHSMAQNEPFFCENKIQEAWTNSTLARMLTAHETEAMWRTHGPILGSLFNSRQPTASQLIWTLCPWGSTRGSSMQQWAGFD